MTVRKIVPVILSGGSGTRLWPMLRPEMPKQMLALTVDETMLQLTAGRALASTMPRRSWLPMRGMGSLHESEVYVR